MEETCASLAPPIRAVLALPNRNGPFGMAQVAAWQTVVDGRHRHVWMFRVPKAPLKVIVPEGFDLCIEIAISGVTCSYWLHPDGESALLVEVMEEGTRILASASAKPVLEALTDGIVARLDQLLAEVAVEPNQDVVLWRLDPHSGPEHTVRRFAPTKFAEIQANYPDPTRSLLARLAALEEPQERGRLVVFHGPPGTGKTRAIRALADAWSSWCDLHVVTDPARLFADPSYLSRVVFQVADNAGGDGSRWKLVVCEDADEYIRAGAWRAGESLGHLLNVTDGLLAEGTRLLVLLTTNKERRELDPALLRPGRALAVVPFRLFSRSEAAAWLGDGSEVLSELALAELYERRAAFEQISADEAPLRTGAYL